MAKKKEGNAGAGILVIILGLIATTLGLIAAVTPFVIYFLKSYFQKEAQGLPEQIDRQYYELTKDEKKELQSYQNELQKSQNLLTDIQSQNISKRQDGYYNERSARGKELNTIWRQTQSEIWSYQVKINELESLPEERLNTWLTAKGYEEASRKTIKPYLFTLLILTALDIFGAPQFMISIENFINEYSWVSLGFLHALHITTIITALLFSAVAAIGFFLYYENKFQNEKRNQLEENGYTFIGDNENAKKIQTQS